MEAIELKARREALGLSQAELAAYLGITQSALSQREVGRKPIPEGFHQELAGLEEVFLQLLDRLAELAESKSAKLHSPQVELATYATDAGMWAKEPELQGVPSALHRVASAHAAWMVREEFEIEVKIRQAD